MTRANQDTPQTQPLDSQAIEHELGTDRIGRSVLCFDVVNSTNDVAWDSVRQGNTDGLVILAEGQRKGRGRHGKSWLSQSGQNILMSILLLDEKLCLSQEAVTIAAGLAVAEGTEQATGVQTELKWPNDVYINRHKLSGIIVERRCVDGMGAMVIGIGLNVNSCPPCDDVNTPPTCLADHADTAPNRQAIIRYLLQNLDRRLAAVATGQLDELQDAWRQRCWMINERLAVRSGGEVVVGRVQDISPLGGLLMIDDRGVHQYLPAAGASILTASEFSALETK